MVQLGYVNVKNVGLDRKYILFLSQSKAAPPISPPTWARRPGTASRPLLSTTRGRLRPTRPSPRRRTRWHPIQVRQLLVICFLFICINHFTSIAGCAPPPAEVAAVAASDVSLFDESRLTVDRHCYECKVKYRDPTAKDLVMFLHAWTYSVRTPPSSPMALEIIHKGPPQKGGWGPVSNADEG